MMKKLFLVVVLVCVCAGISMAQIDKQFDLTHSKYKRCETGTSTLVSATPVVITGIAIYNYLGGSSTSYVIFFDSASATGPSFAATDKRIFEVKIPSMTWTTNTSPANEDWKFIPFTPGIATIYGLATVSDLLGTGIKYTVFYKPLRSTRYYDPY